MMKILKKNNYNIPCRMPPDNQFHVCITLYLSITPHNIVHGHQLQYTEVD